MSNVGYATLGIIPTAKDFTKNLAKETSPGLKAQGEAGGQEYGETFSKGALAKLGAFAKGGAAVAGAAIVGGLLSAMGSADVGAGLQASLGLSAADSGKFGEAAGLAYKQNYGESVAQIGDTIKAAFQSGLVATKDSKEAIAGVVAQVETYAKVSGEDAVSATRAVAQMIKTGIAKDATEAFDLLTRGQQLGINKSEDLLDTFNEYSTQFRKLGLDGPRALGLMNQAIQGGARDSDIAADAFKEFSIRAVDGSKLSADSFKAIGLDGKAMTATFAQGGPKAAEALSLVFDKLKAVKDPAAQSAAAVGLFGTQAEDLGDALFAMDPRTAAKGLGEVAGATERANKALGSTPTAQITAFTRNLKQGFVEVLGGQVLPALTKAAGEFKTEFGPALSDLSAKLKDAAPAALAIATVIIGNLVPAIATAVGVVASVVKFLGEHETTAKALAITMGVLATAYVAFKTVTTALALADMVKNLVTLAKATRAYAIAQAALNLVMMLNPIGLIVLGIAALVAGVVLIATKTTWFQDLWSAAWGAIQKTASAVFNWVKANWPLLLAIITGPIGLAVLAVVKNFDTIKAAAGKVLAAIVNAYKAVTKFFADLPGKIFAALSTAATFLVSKGRDFVSGLLNGIVAYAVNLYSFWTKLPGVIAGKLGALGSYLGNKGRDLVSGLTAGASEKAAALLSYFRDLPGNVAAKLGNLGSSLKSAGLNFAQGFINGIGDMVGKAADKARELASAAKNAIIGILDINSPSRVADDLGRYFGQGFANGIAGMEKAVGQSSAGMAKAAVRGVSSLPIKSASNSGNVPRPVGFGAAGNDVDIFVQGTTDPEATARIVGRKLANAGV
ncbi:phage tail tape measure protein [Kribbella sp. CA-293567]|uniref:phage tail tape measure protein n=1 Tax=Kribbella sp. CA-293567 TaxID=3002436 RepID=UPI0022DD0CCA|nr:phage tail tape measure protein [Kribbella sp. CA-293567]WBQ03790.1 phage tail tape measure protein [Kribbella sp. CA-293567]